MNLILAKSFISVAEQEEILEAVSTLKYSPKTLDNVHIESVAKSLNGFSILHDMTNTKVSHAVSSFQSNNNLVEGGFELFYKFKDKIASSLNISSNHVFFQGVYMKDGGEIKPHYDAAYPGYITYKCNINVKSTPYNIHVDKKDLLIVERDLYCFEASLYKHWVEPCKGERILLSYGFLLPYEELGYEKDNPQIRLSERIQNKFQ